jgi:hypothetical protein
LRWHKTAKVTAIQNPQSIAFCLQTVKHDFDTLSGFRNLYSKDFLTQNLRFIATKRSSLNAVTERAKMTNWSTENPHALREVPVYDLTVGLWCAINARGITGSVSLLRGTKNSRRNGRLVLWPIYNQVADEEK